MRRIPFLLGLFLILSLPALAQESPSAPAAELYAGYAYGRLNTGLVTANDQQHNLNGWNAQVAANLNHWLGLVFDYSGYTGTPIVAGGPVDQRIQAFMVGRESPGAGMAGGIRTFIPYSERRAFTRSPAEIRRGSRRLPWRWAVALTGRRPSTGRYASLRPTISSPASRAWTQTAKTSEPANTACASRPASPAASAEETNSRTQEEGQSLRTYPDGGPLSSPTKPS